MIEVAIENDKPVRIGVNWGSLDQALLTRLMDANSNLDEPKDAREVTMEAMVQSALRSAELAVSYGMQPEQIILSAKVSGVQDLIDVYRELARRCEYPLHLGLTEAGMGAKGIVASTAALAVLLQEGIGDTIRVSLTPAPNGDRTEEVRSRSRFCSRWAFAASLRKSPPAPAAAAPPAPSFRRWPSRSRATCASRCRSGRRATPAWKR